MFITQKCQYGLRAIYELSLRYGTGPRKIGEIAEAQSIPPNFLAVILNQLRQAGLVESKRGADGGYVLTRPPRQVHVSEIIRRIQGKLVAVEGLDGPVPSVTGDAALLPMWREVQRCIDRVCDDTTLEDIIERQRRAAAEYVPDYVI